MKVLYYLLLLLFAPIWAPLCFAYGLVSGTIGYVIFFYQNAQSNYLYDRITLEEGLREAKGAEKEEISKKIKSLNLKFVFNTIVIFPFILILSLVFGFMFGWIKALEVFFKKTHRLFFGFDWRSLKNV